MPTNEYLRRQGDPRVGTSARCIGWISAGVLLLMAFSASAQTARPPLTSNRPGIADSEALVGRGVLQVEAGMQALGAPPGDERRWTQTWGQLNVRLGLSPRIEFFTGWDGLSLNRVVIDGQSSVVAGGNDLRVGAKLAILSEDRHGVTLTVAPAWLFPVGSDEFTSGSNDGSFRILWARSLTRDWSVSGNVLFTRTSDAAGHFWDNGAMAGVTRALSATVSAFGEVSGVLLAERPDAWTVDAGLAWVARPNVQLGPLRRSHVPPSGRRLVRVRGHHGAAIVGWIFAGSENGPSVSS